MTGGAEIPKVTLFFITFNQRAIAVATLRDALSQVYPAERLDIIALDDGSDDGTFAALRAVASGHEHRVRLVADTHEANYRSAALWNRCISMAAPDTDVFVQVDDVRLRPDFIMQHVKWHRDNAPHVVSGAKFEGPEETWQLSACRRRSLAGPGGSARRDVLATAMWGASLSYPRRLMTESCSRPTEQPYDEAMTGYGYHEVELAYRLQIAGGRTVYDPAAGVFHRDHDPVAEQRRGLDRQNLVKQGLADNANFFCVKHGLDALPQW